MTCDKCKYFKVLYEPLRTTGELWDMGRAKCDKHDLITDFTNHGKFKRLATCEYFEPRKSEEQEMSDWIKCDRCNKITKADSSGEKRYKIGLDGFDGYSTFHVCEECLNSFYADYLGWVWNYDEEQYVPHDEQVGNPDRLEGD